MAKRFCRPNLPNDLELLEEAKFLWDYNSESGGFTWKSRRTHRQPRPGKSVGGSDGRGYLMCLLMGHKFKVHQIVWLWHHGCIPKQMIDHINGIRCDNRIENLRLCTPSQNLHNQKRLLDPTRGFRVCRKTGKFRVKIVVGCKPIEVGGFKTKEEAHAAYIEAKRKYAGEFSPQ